MDFDTIRRMANETERIAKTYEIFNEDTRLNRSPAARVEFLTTVRYIERYLRPHDTVLDIGAGAGEYSLYFAEKGHAVTAVELTEVNLAALRKKIRPRHRVSALQGSAVDLTRFADASFDIVLMMGPLYHLRREKDRQKAIAEALRVCKPHGKLFFAFISNDMVILTELMYDSRYLSGDTYDRRTFKVEDFPFVFFTPPQCRAMLQNGGVPILHEVASDGVSELMADTVNLLSPEDYAQYLRYHFYCCEKPEMLGRSNHLLFVGEKPAEKTNAQKLSAFFQAENDRDWESYRRFLHPDVVWTLHGKEEKRFTGMDAYLSAMQAAYEGTDSRFRCLRMDVSNDGQTVAALLENDAGERSMDVFRWKNGLIYGEDEFLMG